MTRMAPVNKALEKHWQEQRERIKHGQVLGRDPLNPAPTEVEQDEARAVAARNEVERLVSQESGHVCLDAVSESLRARLARALARRGTE